MNLKQKLLYAFVGFILGNFLLITLYSGIKNFDRIFPQNDKNIPEQAIKLIKSGKIKKIKIENGQAILTDHLNEKYSFSVTWDSERESVLEKVSTYNSVNPTNAIEISESPSRSTVLSENLLPYLFQIMFILFLISPPIIAFLLFLIWRELKSRNKLK